MKSLRLLVTKQCNRHCAGCCNKDWDLDNLPVVKSFKGFDEIILTGGEPSLQRRLLLRIILRIRLENPTAKIIIYTADVNFLTHYIMTYVDGITLTLHDKHDSKLLELFETFRKDLRSQVTFTDLPDTRYYIGSLNLKKTLRLNVFKGVKIPKLYNNWVIQKDMIWIKDCPLPKNEIFMRYEE